MVRGFCVQRRPDPAFGLVVDAPEGTVITKIQARGSWGATSAPDAGTFEVANVAQAMEEYHDQPTVTGQVTSTFDKDQESVKVVVLLPTPPAPS
jgi:hypothetical protein